MKLLIVPLVALSVLIDRSAVPAIAHPDYGIVTSVQFLEGASLERLRELGAGSVRVGVGWDQVEREKGRYDFAQVRRWIDNARAARLQIYVGLGDPPSWAAPCPVCMPYDLWDWYDYVYHVLVEFRYLGPDVTFGVWNEPNLGKFLNPPAADLYADLFDYADLARLDANPSARLAGPETDPGALPTGWFDAALSRMQRRLRPQDVLTVHWYPGKRSPELSPYMGDVVARAGTRDVWLTETGMKSVDDLEQAQGLLDIVTRFNRRRSTQWAKLFVYRLAGQDPADPDVPFQLLRLDAAFSRRPAFDAYREHMYRILTVSMQSADGYWVSAENNGGSIVTANRSAVGAWETFELDDLNGGALQTGDLVRLKTSLGIGMQVIALTGPRLPAPPRHIYATDSCACADSGVFVVTAIDGEPVADGGRLALRSYKTGLFVSVDAGSGTLLANRSSVGPSETFRLVLHY